MRHREADNPLGYVASRKSRFRNHARTMLNRMQDSTQVDVSLCMVKRVYRSLLEQN